MADGTRVERGRTWNRGGLGHKTTLKRRSDRAAAAHGEVNGSWRNGVYRENSWETAGQGKTDTRKPSLRADVMKSWGERRRAGKAEGEVEVEIFPTQLTSECNGMVRGREMSASLYECIRIAGGATGHPRRPRCTQRHVRHWRKGKEGRDERWGERIEGKFEVEVKVGPLCPDRTTRGNGMVRDWGIERVSLRMYLDRERRNGPPPSSSSHATA